MCSLHESSQLTHFASESNNTVIEMHLSPHKRLAPAAALCPIASSSPKRPRVTTPEVVTLLSSPIDVVLLDSSPIKSISDPVVAPASSDEEQPSSSRSDSLLQLDEFGPLDPIKRHLILIGFKMAREK